MNNDFLKKVTTVQAELKAPKNLYNNFGKFRYRSCEAILEAVKPLLVSNGLLLTISDSVEAVGDYVYVKATATITDGTDTVSNSALARDPITKSGMDGAQITGASSSYARKYALNGLFLIDDSIDDDGMDNSEPKATAKPVNNANEREELLKKAAELEINFSSMLKYYKKESIDELSNDVLKDAINKKSRKAKTTTKETN